MRLSHNKFRRAPVVFLIFSRCLPRISLDADAVPLNTERQRFFSSLTRTTQKIRLNPVGYFPHRGTVSPKGPAMFTLKFRLFGKFSVEYDNQLVKGLDSG